MFRRCVREDGQSACLSALVRFFGRTANRVALGVQSIAKRDKIGDEFLEE